MPSLLKQTFKPRCPRCGEGRMFRDWLAVVDACSACGLTLKHHDAADGPAFFALVFVGFLIMALVGLVEHSYEPPLWVHAALWIPLTLLFSIAFLRMFKAMMITIEFRLGQLKGDDSHQ